MQIISKNTLPSLFYGKLLKIWILVHIFKKNLAYFFGQNLVSSKQISAKCEHKILHSPPKNDKSFLSFYVFTELYGAIFKMLAHELYRL
jgi:hypothetical protein